MYEYIFSENEQQELKQYYNTEYIKAIDWKGRGI